MMRRSLASSAGIVLAGMILLLAGGTSALPGVAPPLPGGTPPHDSRPLPAAEPMADFIEAMAEAPVSLDGLPATVTRLLRDLPGAEARRLRRRATLWQGWSPEQRAAFAARAGEWDALSAVERARRREAWKALQALPEAQRDDVLGMARDFARRSEAEQAELRQRFAALDPVARHGWRLGPVLGADYPALHPLLAQLPADQHERLLDALQSLSAAQRVQLGVLVQRTPPQERDALRTELIETPPERRQDWLWKRLEM